MKHAKSIMLIAIGGFIVAYAYGMFGPRDNGDTVEVLRGQLQRATDANRSLQADNERLSEINTRLGKELADAVREAEESQRIASELRNNNRKTAGDLETAGNIVTRLRSVASEVRAGNKTPEEKK